MDETLHRKPFHTELVRKHFALFEEVSEVAHGWNLNFCQLGETSAPFYLNQLSGTSILVSRATLSPGFYQQGGTAPGYRTVSLLAAGSGGCVWRWCGEAVSSNSLLVMPVGGEFESVSSPNLDSVHLAIPITLLEQVAERQFQMPLHALMPDTRCFCPEGGWPLRKLRAYLQGLTTSREESGERLFLTPALEAELVYLVLACLAESGAELPSGPRSKRMRCLARALEVLDESPGHRLGIDRLVTEVGVSRRTLENAFRDGLGVGPVFFMKSRRLQRLHRALLSTDDASLGVAGLARAEGFHHLGQLSADYRQMFGELPSVTLGRRIT